MEGMSVEIIIILALIVANGFFAASEIAVVSARKGRLEQRSEEGHNGSKIALELAENPNRFLSTVQVGITLISTLASAFGGARIANSLADSLRGLPWVGSYANSVALALVVLLISYLSLIVGELVPKRLALQNAESVAAQVAPPMRLLSRLASPVVSFLTFSTEAVLRLLGRHNVEETPVTEDDVLALVREGAAEGTLDAAEQALISSVFTFNDRTVRSVMTPRTQMFAINVAMPVDEVLSVVSETGYSRIPVFEDNADHVLGVLYFKDVLRAAHSSKDVDIRALLRAPIYLPESQRAVLAFQELRKQRSALAIVLDEYGQVAGVISMEDILEELVGSIDDEYDEDQESIVKRDDGSYLVDGLLGFEEARQRLGFPEPDEALRDTGFETLAGFLLALTGQIPTEGTIVEWNGFRFEVVDMDARRIDKVLISPPRLSDVNQTESVLATGAVSTLSS